ncbi:MAG: TIGR03435 family protein [Acidobacteriota bacterium]
MLTKKVVWFRLNLPRNPLSSLWANLFRVPTCRPYRFIVALCFASTIALSQPPAKPAYEVASIHVATPKPGPSQLGCNGTRFMANTPLAVILSWAFEVGQFQLEGLPEWTVRERYEIQASMRSPLAEKDCKRMVQGLFEDRFQLRVARSLQKVSGYRLVRGKKGPKVVQVGTALAKTDGRAVINGFPLGGEQGVSMGRLTEFLSTIPFIQKPVVDATELNGTFQFSLSFAPFDENGADIFTAVQEQLGLKLEASNVEVEVVKVERIERPEPN